MLKSLKIENFRCFQTFELQKLGRVNLLVGNNNSGKTSILEAIQLLCSRNNLSPLADALDRRGEYLGDDVKSESGLGSEFDVSHLFYGHQFQVDKSFSISATKNGTKDEVPIKISVSVFKSSEDLFNKKLDNNKAIRDLNDLEIEKPEILFEWFQDGSRDPLGAIAIDIYAGFSRNILRRYSDRLDKKMANTYFIESSSLTIQNMMDLFEKVVLAPEEDLVYKSLQTIEPKIERIATIGFRNYRNASRGGFVVRFTGDNQRIPIGSMGDGIWRMLGIALAIVNTKDGVLLIDEIDTGLHFSVMTDMWKLILEASKRLNVQVFATTHNSDCWTSLAAVANVENHTGDENITIHRIERDKSISVMFNERQMAIAAERGIEVR
jgi:AAA15 family ATPase/GTPase